MVGSMVGSYGSVGTPVNMGVPRVCIGTPYFKGMPSK